MKRFFYLSLLSLLCAAPVLRAEDASALAARQETDENFKILKARLDDLSESRVVLQNRIQSLEKEITELRAQAAKPNATYATPDDLKRLADTIQEVDKKRIEDNKKTIKELGDLAKILSHGGSHIKEPAHTDDTSVAVPPIDPNQPTFTYTIKQGDFLSTIVKAYHEKGVNVTVDEILKVNPGLKPTQLYVGKKIQIPDTRGSATKPDAK